MKNSKPIYYWDACIFLAWLGNKPSDAAILEGIEEIVKKIDDKQCFLVTSQMTRIEVLESSLSDIAQNKFNSVLRRSNVSVVDINSKVGSLSSEIRDYQRKNGLRTLKSPDAIHLATAILYSVDELHTIDASDLLKLGNRICNKYTINICKPPQPIEPSLPFVE